MTTPPTVYPPRHVRRRRPLVALATIALVTASGVLAACSDVAEPVTENLRYGAVSFVGRNGPNGTVTAIPTMTFIRAFAQVPNSAALATDQCGYAAIDTTPQAVLGQYRAGDSITVAIGGRTIKLGFRTDSSRYDLQRSGSTTYSSGDIATITVPGADTSFPASSISLKLAEPLIPGPVAAPQVSGDPMRITWNATNDSSSAVLLFLRYGNTSQATRANEQIYCQMRDDGQTSLAYSTLSAFVVSPVATRSLRMIRFRTNVLQLDTRTILHAASQVDTTVQNVR